MAHRRRKEFVPEPLGIRATSDTLRVKLETEYREAVGLSWVEEVLNSDRGFCHLTSFRADRAFSGNNKAFQQMTREFQGLTARPDLGAYWLIAHWVEPAGVVQRNEAIHERDGREGTQQHSIEYSWLFTQPPGLDSDDWLLAAELLAQAHRQPAFILRAQGSQVARLRGGDGGDWRSLSGADEILSAAKILAFLRSRGGAWGRPDYERLAFRAPDDVVPFPVGSFFAAHPATEAATVFGPDAILFYAATPHNNSARMFFSVLKVWNGG